MSRNYEESFAQIEEKWQTRWRAEGLFDSSRGEGPRYYCLNMYPYPSGALHMGHVINYTLGDVVVRHHLMRGDRVLSPMGWDAFGLPAENHAIRSGIHPEDSTLASIATMRKQMERAGWGYDWSREVATCLPDYYRWTQWIFVKLFEADLAYQKKAPVNWCPSCSTVLANEQVHDGHCERCDTEVEARDLVQWFFRMSKYAQRLLDGHAKLRGGWPDMVIKQQEDWIGRSEGARLDFRVDAPGSSADGETLSVFTTRPDTTFGVTFMALAPEHPLVPRLVAGTDREEEVLGAVRRMRLQPRAERTSEEAEKEGVFTGRHVINPFDGSRGEIWVTNYALMEYGTGAVMAVPAHDQRDFLFAVKYGLPIRQVIRPSEGDLPEPLERAFEEPGVMVNSGRFDGMPSLDAKRAMTEDARDRGTGDFQIHYRLKDWLLSRQRYWGAPIPVVHCESCGIVPVPEKDLPVLLPREGVEFRPTGESPLARSEAFWRTPCPRCGAEARRETDTMDTFVDSSWYFLRYPCAHLQDAAWDPAVVAEWLPVHQYIGGIEHATMHLIYARFLTMALHDLGHSPIEEPFARLFCQGMVCAPAFYCEEHKWLGRDELTMADPPACAHCGREVRSQVYKMSKTKKNGASPDEQFRRYGADTVRTAILFLGPADQDIEYDERGVQGVNRFLRRVWDTFWERREAILEAARPTPGGDPGRFPEPWKSLRRKSHEVLRKITDTFDRHQFSGFNTCIAAMMELTNELRAAGAVAAGEPSAEAAREALEILISGLAPFAPHMAEELWEGLGRGTSIFQSGWPEVDERALERALLEVVVQVNGKVRGRLEVPPGLDQDAARELVLASEEVTGFLEGRTLRKFIWVPDRLANVVVG